MTAVAPERGVLPTTRVEAGSVTETPPGHRARLNGLDGFRALAVIVVVLYHFDVPGFGGGWIGPELFFVLSGFLITTLMLDETHRTGRLAVLDFWRRRVRRLYPAILFLVAILVPAVAVLTALGLASTISVSPGSLSSEAFSTLGYYANWHFIQQHVGYFGQTPSLLKHTWSLAIEEQFYLVFPIVFIVTRRMAARSRALPLLLLGAGALASAAYAASEASPSTLNFVYYSTQTNAYHLLIGVCLAIATFRWRPSEQTARVLDVLSLPAIGVVVVFVEVAAGRRGTPGLWMFRGGSFALDLAAAALILSLVHGTGRSIVSWVFNLRPIVWIGAVSYGIYLWHYPIGVLFLRSFPGVSRLIIVPALVAATVIAAALSYGCVEVVVREKLLRQGAFKYGVYATGVVAPVLLVVLATSVIRQ
ncbi:MAG: acyltransferase [Acidimicrobiaceae bacterium]|nr:acyltransferase [Acidimicrobiaceae bacterium]